MGKNREHEKYVKLLEENYLMLKVIKTSEDSTYLFEKSLENIADSLRVVKKGLEFFGDATDLLDTVENLVEDLKTTARTMAETYCLIGSFTEVSNTGEEVADGNT